MDRGCDKSFDFSVRIIELVKYLAEEKKPYPLSERLLTCATGIGICLRMAELTGKRSADYVMKALGYAVEAEFLLETMGKTGFLTEKQSLPIISDCRSLKTLVTELFHKAN